MQCACAILSSVACPILQYFSTLSHKRRDFLEKVTEHKMCVLIFSITFVWNIIHSNKKWTRYCHTRILVSMQSTRYSCLILMLLDFSRLTFEKHSFKYNENLSSGSRVVPRGQADIGGGGTHQFSQFLRKAPRNIKTTKWSSPNCPPGTHTQLQNDTLISTINIVREFSLQQPFTSSCLHRTSSTYTHVIVQQMHQYIIRRYN